MADEEEVFMGIAHESKAPNAKGPMVGPSSSKRKRSEPNANEKEADALKKRKGGRQPYTNSAQYISHEDYNTVPSEDSTQRRRSEPQESPLPPPEAHESYLKTPDSHLEEKSKRIKNAEKGAKKAEKDQAREEVNRHLIKSDIEKKKAEAKLEGRSKHKHDPRYATLKKKSASRKRPAKPAEPESNSSGQDDPPLTREEIDATPSEEVNVTTSTVLPDLRASVVPAAHPKENTLKRKTPPTTVTMVDKVNTTPHPDAIDLHNLVVDAPVGATKPGEKLLKKKVKQIKAPSAEQNAPRAKVVKEKAVEFAPKLTQTLESLPPTDQNVAWIAPAAQAQDDSDAPHSFNHVFIMELLDRFVEDLFDGEV
nr:uncharacterized protein LOC109754516 [Aegilops tauschii subsp. strangulata]